MTKYESGDLVTCYFVIVDDLNGSRIQAWSDDKNLVKFYLEFHKCKNYKLKTLTKPLEDFTEIINESIHDEIQLTHLKIKDPNHKKGKQEFKLITVPLTVTEITFINTESATFMLSRVNYGYLNGVIPYLKDKYQRALNDIFLNDVIKKVVHEQNTKFTRCVDMDQLMVLFRSFPDHFGR